MDAMNGRDPPKKRRRKSSDPATNDASKPSSNGVATNACQGKPCKGAASKRPPAETSENLPASPQKPEAERIAVVTPPESRLTSAEPQEAVVAETAVSGGGGEAARGVEQHSARLSSTERLVDSTSLNKEVASASTAFGDVGLQAQVLSTMTTTAAAPESSSALPLEGDDEELLDMESEMPMEAIGASVTGRCLPIPTEDDSLWPRLPMPDPGPEVEAVWAPACGSETSGLGPNWWHYSYSSGDIGADSGWGGVSAIKPPEMMFSFPPFPPPLSNPPLLPGNTTVGVEMPGARKEQEKEQPVPTQERGQKRATLEAAAGPAEPMSSGEGNGISLLAAAAEGRARRHAPEEFGERAVSKVARPRKAMRDAESAGRVSTSVGGNQANKEHWSSDGQAGPSAAPPAGNSRWPQKKIGPGF